MVAELTDSCRRVGLSTRWLVTQEHIGLSSANRLHLTRQSFVFVFLVSEHFCIGLVSEQLSAVFSFLCNPLFFFKFLIFLLYTHANIYLLPISLSHNWHSHRNFVDHFCNTIPEKKYEFHGDQYTNLKTLNSCTYIFKNFVLSKIFHVRWNVVSGNKNHLACECSILNV